MTLSSITGLRIRIFGSGLSVSLNISEFQNKINEIKVREKKYLKYLSLMMGSLLQNIKNFINLSKTCFKFLIFPAY